MITPQTASTPLQASTASSPFSRAPTEEKLYDWAGGAFAGLVLTLIVAWVGFWLKRLALRSRFHALTGFNPESSPVAVVGSPIWALPGTIRVTESRRALPLIGYGPLSAYALMSARITLARFGIKQLPELVLGDQFFHLTDDKKQGSDILLLGFPAGNAAAMQLEPMFHLPTRFETKPHREIISTSDGVQLAHTEYAADDKAGHDIAVRDAGIVSRLVHPLNPMKRILYIAGCETFGVKIAAEGLTHANYPNIMGFNCFMRALWTLGIIPTIANPKRSRIEFLAIFEAKVSGLSTGTSALKHSWVRNMADSNPTWKKVFPKR